MIQSDAATNRLCTCRHSSSAGATQPGFQKWRSRWMSGRPVLAASAREKVLLPDPANPVTRTRRPISGPARTGRKDSRAAPLAGTALRQGEAVVPHHQAAVLVRVV